MRFLMSITAMTLPAIAVMHLWRWFLVPLGVVEIGILHALGVRLLLAGVLPVPPVVEQGELLEHTLLKAIYYWSILWFLGFVVSRFL